MIHYTPGTPAWVELRSPDVEASVAFYCELFGGAQVFNQPISLTFNLLMTRQPHAAKWFYSKIFGWEPRDRKIGGIAFTYFFRECAALLE